MFFYICLYTVVCINFIFSASNPDIYSVNNALSWHYVGHKLNIQSEIVVEVLLMEMSKRTEAD